MHNREEYGTNPNQFHGEEYGELSQTPNCNTQNHLYTTTKFPEQFPTLIPTRNALTLFPTKTHRKVIPNFSQKSVKYYKFTWDISHIQIFNTTKSYHKNSSEGHWFPTSIPTRNNSENLSNFSTTTPINYETF